LDDYRSRWSIEDHRPNQAFRSYSKWSSLWNSLIVFRFCLVINFVLSTCCEGMQRYSSYACCSHWWNGWDFQSFLTSRCYLTDWFLADRFLQQSICLGLINLGVCGDYYHLFICTLMHITPCKLLVSLWTFFWPKSMVCK
jgi:hypothetical protein